MEFGELLAQARRCQDGQIGCEGEHGVRSVFGAPLVDLRECQTRGDECFGAAFDGAAAAEGGGIVVFGAFVVAELGEVSPISFSYEGRR
ncbi:hypothetical protein ACLQ2P_26095 [Actinomadura citrea]|uniref:hypothetical protein n=1 Tax=Actinomadura citrea TaxID=46158 RepID=UPI003CE473CF